MDTKRIRVPASDQEGYNREIISKRSYVVVYPDSGELSKRIFTEYQEALELCEQHSGKIEEVLLVLQIKTIYPVQI